MLTEAGKSLYQDAKYIISYCDGDVKRAQDAMLKQNAAIRIGTSLMTPPQFLVEIWPQIHGYCPEIKFQFVPFDNTQENAREILKSFGRNFDVVAGIFDSAMLEQRECDGAIIFMELLCCAVSVSHPLASKDRLSVEDLYGKKLLLMHRGWSSHEDSLRDDLTANHPEIQIVDFDFYSVDIFNQCEQNQCILMAVEKWRNVHPLLKIIPVDWGHKMPFGILHSPDPSEKVKRLLSALSDVMTIK